MIDTISIVVESVAEMDWMISAFSVVERIFQCFLVPVKIVRLVRLVRLVHFADIYNSTGGVDVRNISRV